MKDIQIPESVTLVDGSVIKLAPLAMNKNFIAFMVTSQQANVEAAAVIGSMLTCVGDCIKNGNRELNPEQVSEKLELLPVKFVTDLIDESGG